MVEVFIIMRILIIEDEKSLAELVANRLKKEKYMVDLSFDGEEGLYNALEGVYDLILLDIMLPGIDGISSLTMNMKSSKFKGIIDAKEGTVSLSLDKNSTITLTGDSYVTSLSNEDTTNSNINFNGYKFICEWKMY